MPLRPVLLALVAIVLFHTAGCGGDDNAGTTIARGGTVASPVIEGPVSGGAEQPFIGSTAFDLASVGYAQAEYFLSGTATAYTNAGPLTADGRWSVVPGATAAYRTRLLVYRPVEPARFNGTLVLEWLNVSGGVDASPDWTTMHTELIREGYAWAGISAQIVGVEGGSSIVGLPVRPLKKEDPARYGSLVHPGDSFSYDIFSQAGQAIRRPNGPNPLGDLTAETVIAAGESQSAFRLVTYIDAIHPRDDMYDGFLVHSRGGTFGAAALSEAPQPSITVPSSAPSRTDLNVPVLTFQTETDLTLLGSLSARQADSDIFRLWEVAGTAHADTYTLFVGRTDVGDSPEVAKLIVTTTPIPGVECIRPINSGPQHFVLNAAIAALNDWVVHGTPPPSAPRIEVTAAGAIARDSHGNALGGIRTPQLDVPLATLSGEGQVGSILCLLFGTTVPFDSATASALYVDQGAYVAAFDQATDRAVEAGFILPPDADLLKAAAASTALP